jgi:hypothetical protein
MKGLKLSDAQHRLLNDMVGSTLRRTPKGLIAKSGRAHHPVALFKLQEYGLARSVSAGTYELTEDGFQLATRRLRGEV